ncbi:MAG: YrzE family protein [Persicimonas sp.]
MTETYEEPRRESSHEESESHYEEAIERHDERVVPPSRASWGAIFAGTLVALGVSFLLSLLGGAIGFSGMEPGQGAATMEQFSTPAGIWLIFQIVISLFVGGWVAGRLAGKPRSLDGVLNGGVVWALTVLLALFGLTTVATNIIGGLTNITQEGAAATEGVAADAIASGMWWTLFAVGLGLLAACIGGWIGSPKMEAYRPVHDERRETERVTGRRRKRGATPAE